MAFVNKYISPEDRVCYELINIKRLAIIPLVAFALSLSNALAGPFTFPEQADQLAKEIDRAFVNMGVCKDLHECNKRELVYRSGTNEHQTVFIFKVHTIDKVAIERAIQIASDAYYRNNRRITIEIIGYRESREEKVRWFSGAKPVVQIAFRRDE